MEYKLIDTYPGSPDLGVVLLYKEGKYLNDELKLEFDKDLIENNPRHWEKNTETGDNFNLLTLKSAESNCQVMIKGNEFKFSTDLMSYKFDREFLFNLIRDDNLIISSVERNCDKVRFSLGDLTNEGVITSITLDRHNRLSINGLPYCKFITLDKIEPSFILSNEGIKLKLNSGYFTVDKSTSSVSGPFFIRDTNFLDNRSHKDKYFYKHSAKLDLLHSIVSLSLNDVFKFYPKYKKGSKELTKHAKELENYLINKLNF